MKALRSASLALILPLFIAAPVLAKDTAPRSALAGGNEYLSAATVWYQTSAEARALCYQAFNLARMMLDQDLREKAGSAEKRAVVVDVDETVLDNSPYQARMIKDGFTYPTGWREWIDEARALPVPGAVDFLRYAHSKGVKVFYVTNRKDAEKPGTMKNLKAVGFPDVTEETVVTRSDTSNKEPRRKKVAEQYRIVLLVGDNLNDFAEGFADTTVDTRFANTDRARELWGTRYIVLPNPMYGDWEGTVYGNDYRISAEEKAKRRQAALRLK